MAHIPDNDSMYVDSLKNIIMERLSVPVACFIFALVVRLIATPVSIITDLNPYTLADATGFADAAAYIAAGVFSGDLFIYGMSYIETAGPGVYHKWGLLLSPFWLIPGPSLWYATIFVAILGSLAIYNVAHIAEYLHSSTAAIVAALPMIFYPSHVFIHTAVLRDAAVLFTITSAAALLIVHIRTHLILSIIGAIILLGVGTLLRSDNAPLFVLAVVIAFLAWIVPLSRSWLARLAPVGTVAGIAVIPYIAPLRNRLLFLRDVRYRGRTAYLESLPLETGIDALVNGTIAAFYFLFTPFPWMIYTIADLAIAVEAIISILFSIAALIGAKEAYRRAPIVTVALTVTFIAAVVIYGFGTANVGTATRHRQSFLWVIFLFGSIGFVRILNILSNSTALNTTRRQRMPQR